MIDATQYNEWQQRVVNEQIELDRRLLALDMFFYKQAYEDLPVQDKALLASQHHAMTDYSRILGDRIARFNHAPD